MLVAGLVEWTEPGDSKGDYVGYHGDNWEGSAMSGAGQHAMSGVYFCELKTATASLERKLVLVH